jgi:formylglycine-generating enzyme
MPRPLAMTTVTTLALMLAATAIAQPDPTPPAADDLDVEFVQLPAGSFAMGSPRDEWGARVDETQHQVTITRPFYLAATEVTQRQWRALTGSNPSYLYDCPDCPVEGITWLAAVSYCNAFSAQVGLTPAYVVVDTVVTWDRTSDGFRLPTEAEWEYACRAGTSTPFSTGACLTSDQANYDGYGPTPGCPSGLWRDQSLEVRSFAPNAWGLYDMHGNVAELCWDRHAYHRASPAVDPSGPATGARRVVKGGSFRDFALECRSACRQQTAPADRQRYIGMRLARSQPQK